MSEMLKRLEETQALLEGEHDNLLEAIAAMCAAGQMTAIPRPDNLIHKPVILLPQRMYDRLIERHGKDDSDE